MIFWGSTVGRRCFFYLPVFLNFFFLFFSTLELRGVFASNQSPLRSLPCKRARSSPLPCFSFSQKCKHFWEPCYGNAKNLFLRYAKTLRFAQNDRTQESEVAGQARNNRMWSAMTGVGAACGRTKFAPTGNLEEKSGTLRTASPTFPPEEGTARLEYACKHKACTGRAPDSAVRCKAPSILLHAKLPHAGVAHEGIPP